MMHDAVQDEKVARENKSLKIWIVVCSKGFSCMVMQGWLLTLLLFPPSSVPSSSPWCGPLGLRVIRMAMISLTASSVRCWAIRSLMPLESWSVPYHLRDLSMTTCLR